MLMDIWILKSSVGRKIIMSVTGVGLAGFLLTHSVMNLVVLFSPAGYNAICEFLGDSWYAVLATIALAGMVVGHFAFAFLLTLQNLLARGNNRYAVTTRQKGVSWASKNMLVLGIIIFGFLVMHLAQFWYRMQFTEVFLKHSEAYQFAANGALWVHYYFSQTWVSIVYLICFVALWFHLTHGIWSGLHSLGLNNKTWLPRVKMISNAVATLVVLMFSAIPVYYLLGFYIVVPCICEVACDVVQCISLPL